MIDMLIYCINVVTLYWYPTGQRKSVPFPSMLRVVLKKLLTPSYYSLMNSHHIAIELRGNMEYKGTH